MEKSCVGKKPPGLCVLLRLPIVLLLCAPLLPLLLSCYPLLSFKQTPYCLHWLPYEMAYAKQQYIFDIEKIKLPCYLQTVLTRESHLMLQKVVDDASLAFRYLKDMEKLRDERYRAMCSRRELSRYIMHAESVDRLFSWGQDHKPHDPALAPPAKISPYVLRFHVDQHAYDEFVERYNKALNSYLNYPYQRWRDSKKMLERMVAKSGVTKIGREAFLRWWRETFLAEMAKWEDRLAGLFPPTWEEVVDDVYFAILERVDIGTSTVDEFYIGSAA